MIDRALSVRQLASRWSVSLKKIRAMIRRGILAAFDVGNGKRQWRIAPEAVHAAEQQRLAVRKPAPRRQSRIYISPTAAAMLEDDA